MNKLIEINSLTVGYENKPNVLNDVSLTIFEDDFLGVIGPNGGGKTTLLKTILGLIKPQSGSVNFYDKGIKVPSLNIGYLPQINQVDKKFPISVSEVILSGITPDKKFFRRYSSEERKRVEHVSHQLGITSILNRAIGELSGGQLQRVLLGRAIIDNPKLIILDEPSTGVDEKSQNEIYPLLQDLNINHGKTIISVEHNTRTALKYSTHILKLSNGQMNLYTRDEFIKLIECENSISNIV